MNKVMVKIILIGTVAFYSFSSAQDVFELMYQDYKNHKYTNIKTQLARINQEQKSRLEYKFYVAIFNTNGEEAKESFQLIFEKGNPKFKKLAAKKLMDYYYAKGYYVNASKYQEFLIDEDAGQSITEDSIVDQILKQPTIEPNLPKEDSKPAKYFIQVGAFSLKENANQLVTMLATQNIRARMVERKIDQKNLYCVWLNGKEDFKKTFNYANVIKEKYDLKFRIIK